MRAHLAFQFGATSFAQQPELRPSAKIHFTPCMPRLVVYGVFAATRLATV